jgi:hypothetical protein
MKNEAVLGQNESKMKCIVVMRDFLSHEEISCHRKKNCCHRKKIPVTGTKFCCRNKIPVI